MKFNFRLPIRELCAAGAVALASAILIAGCATGEHTGKFWNKNDVASSDAYVAAEMARDQSFAVNSTPAAGANGKVAAVGATQAATQDGTGRVAVPDFADQPPAPLTPPAAVDVTSSPQADAGRTAAGGAAAGSAQTATVVAGGAQTAGDAAAGSIVAPYVQKRAPSGTFDNSRHDDEIVKPKQVFAKQLDPFAATDAEPAVVPPITTRQTPPAAPASRLVNSAPTLASATAPAATAHAALPNANPWDAESAVPPASTKPNATLTPIQQAPAPPSMAPSLPAAVAVPAATADAFDPSLPPPVPVSATSTSAEASAVPSQPASVPSATAAPTPNAFESPKSAAAAPAHPHAGIRLGDEDLDENQPSPTHSEEKQVVEPAATQVTAEAHPPAAATPYEADRPATAVTTPPACVTTPPARMTPHPASVTVPASPPATQDSWESTKAYKPTAGLSESSATIPATVPVTARVLAPMELAPRQHAPAPPAAVESVPVDSAPAVSAPVTSTHSVSAPIQTSAASSADAPIKAIAEQERVVTAKVYAEHHKTGGGSDPMICDSKSVHGKYMGGDEPPLAAAPQNLHDAAGQKPNAAIHPATSANPASPAAKKAAATDRKTASLWDDPFSSGTPTRSVLTADFSVPAPPAPFEADDARSIGTNAAPACQQSACAGALCSSKRSRSRAWIAIGIAGGVAAITVVWRRRRPQGEPELD
jgi:hypothetical protein